MTFAIPLDEIDFAMDEAGVLLNPRGKITDTTDLQASMRLVGQRTPVQVYERNSRYVPIDGHRRITAARAMGWQTINAEIVETPEGEAKLLEQMLAANVRQEMKATALGRAIQRLAIGHKRGVERVAKICGIDPQRAHLLVDLLNAPESVQRRVDSGEMSIGAFRDLRHKPAEVQEKIAAMPRPTVKAIRAAVKEKDAPSGLLAGLLDQMAAQDNPAVSKLNEARAALIAGWQALTDSERARVHTLVEAMHQFIQESDYALAV